MGQLGDRFHLRTSFQKSYSKLWSGNYWSTRRNSSTKRPSHSSWKCWWPLLQATLKAHTPRSRAQSAGGPCSKACYRWWSAFQPSSSKYCISSLNDQSCQILLKSKLGSLVWRHKRRKIVVQANPSYISKEPRQYQRLALAKSGKCRWPAHQGCIGTCLGSRWHLAQHALWTPCTRGPSCSACWQLCVKLHQSKFAQPPTHPSLRQQFAHGHAYGRFLGASGEFACWRSWRWLT